MVASADALREIPLFKACSDRSIEIISGIVREATFPDGAVLVREGDPGDSLIIIRRGSATVDQGGTTVRRLASGDFLGEIALIDGRPRTATVVAAEPIEALVIDRAGFSRLMDEFPVIRFDLVSALTDRLRSRGPAPTD
jgi:CRP/FNR family transcriptional regulator, cyclic AMP receptor protein